MSVAAAGQALGTYYDSLQTVAGNQLITSTSGGFYYAAVPEPSTYALVLVSAAFSFAALRRRKQFGR